MSEENSESLIDSSNNIKLARKSSQFKLEETRTRYLSAITDEGFF